MAISVIIFNKEKNQDLIPCVESVLKQKFDKPFEVIIIDNFSQNNCLDLLKNMPLYVIKNKKKAGWFKVLQIAAETTKFDILAFTDSHCVVDEDWLRKIDESIVGKNVFSGNVYHGKGFKEKFSQLFTHFEFSSLERKNIKNIFDGNFVIRRNFLKSVFKDLPLNASVDDGAGAMILANTILRNGGQICHEPDVKVFHISETFWKSMRQWFFVFGGNTIFIRKFDPKSKGAKYLKLGFLAPFIFALARWISLSKNFFTSWKAFGMKIYELPVYFLWYNACIFSYFLGMTTAMVKTNKTEKLNKRRGSPIINLKRLYKLASYKSGIAYRPLKTNIEVTDFCNLRCPTCSKWKEQPEKKELTGEQWQYVLNKAKGFALSKILTISGGEPFYRRDIFEILGYALNAGYEPIVISNGTLLNEEKIAKLKNYKVRQIILSINGIKPQTHDPTRGIDGSLTKTLNSLEILRKNEIPVVIETILLRTNVEEIIDLVKLVQEKKIKGIIFQVLTASNVHNLFIDEYNRVPEKAWYKDDPLWIKDTKRFSQVVDELIRMKKEGAPIINPFEQMKLFPIYYENQNRIKETPCTSGVSNFMIDPYGEVRQCYSFESIGNILEETPEKIWGSLKAKEIRGQIKKCDKTCRLLNNTF
jgi:MoaA/NifB/PqqE/SkfB family radical SAM enzyme